MEFQPMSPDEVQRTVQFLLNQQAQFAADLSAMQARFATDLSATQAQLAAGLSATQAQFAAHLSAMQAQLGAGLSATQTQFAAGFEKLTTYTNRIADAVIDLTGLVGQLANQVDRLQQHTDAMFERHLREDHGYRPS